MNRSTPLIPLAAAALCLVGLSGCSNNKEVTFDLAIASYTGDINPDGAAFNGKLVSSNGCLTVDDGDNSFVIAVNDSQKNRLEDMFTQGTLTLGEQANVPGSATKANHDAVILPQECTSTTDVWLLGDVDAIQTAPRD